jgi:PAS domain S-box-containing protein
MGNRIRAVCLAAALWAACLPCPGPVRAQRALPVVLLLSSYHHGDPWSDRIVEGFLERLPHDKARVHVEHLDARRFNETADRSLFASYLAAKYAHTPVALLVSSDDAALDFWLANRETLFPGRAIVFCGVNDYTPARIAGYADVTGVGESPDVVGTLELALALVPEARTVLALTADDAASSRANIERLRRATLALERRIRLVELRNITLEAARQALAAAPRDAVALRLAPINNAAGESPIMGEDMAVLAASSPVPFFCLWDFDLGLGAVGGRVLRGRAQGRAAAAMAEKVLAGQPAGQLAVTDVAAETVLDHGVMTRLGLPLDRVPQDTVYENAPASLYERHKGLFWAGGAALAVSVPGALILLVILSGRRRTEARLTESERRYRELVESANSLILRFDATGRLEFVNEYAERLLGYSRAEMLSGKATFWPAAPPDLSSLLARAMAAPHSLARAANENEVTAKDGRRVYLQWDNQPLFAPDGRPEGWLAVGADITARRLAEEALASRAMAEEELALFGRELLAGGPEAVDRGLVRLLTAFAVGRAVWFDNLEDPHLGLCCRPAAEAFAAGLSPRRDTPETALVPYSIDGFHWADRMAAGEIVAGQETDFPEVIQDILRVFEAKAVLAAPVTRNGVWSGFLVLADVRSARRFTRQEHSLISTAASLLSVHLSRA